MRIALMSGAYVNAGDFLIEQRCMELLKANLPNAQVDILKRNVPYDDKLELLNSYDLLVFGGGPGFQPALYPNKMPFVTDLNRLKTPAVVLGWGWKGSDTHLKTLYKDYCFSDKMQKFISYIVKSGKPLACRDWYTVQMLRAAGFNALCMTGCPAWYNPLYINNLHPKDRLTVQKICISDSAYTENLYLLEKLAEWVRVQFPSAEIKLIFHRGIHKKNLFLTAEKFTERLHITYVDISGSADGFRLYDECDLHIGFRVHAHIYNLSMGNPSILLNEDARGYGVNDALGIRNIPLERPSFTLKKWQNDYLQKQVNDYWEFLIATNFLQYKTSCCLLREYYGVMQKYICAMADLQ